MSVWTHVAGIIRVDSFDANEGEKIIKNALGADVNDYLDDYEALEALKEEGETIIPYGSEGRLDYEIWKNPDSSCMASNYVTIFGDLRDYEDLSEIEEWFIKVLKNRAIFGCVRNGCLSAFNEYSGIQYTMTFIDNEWFFGAGKTVRIVTEVFENGELQSDQTRQTIIYKEG